MATKTGPQNTVTTTQSHDDLISPPEAAHLRESHEEPRRRHSSATTVSDHESSSEDEREATELTAVRPAPPQGQRPKLSRVLSPGKPLKHWYDPVKRYWRHEIRISVPHVDCRDHLGTW